MLTCRCRQRRTEPVTGITNATVAMLLIHKADDGRLTTITRPHNPNMVFLELFDERMVLAAALQRNPSRCLKLGGDVIGGVTIENHASFGTPLRSYFR